MAMLRGRDLVSGSVMHKRKEVPAPHRAPIPGRGSGVRPLLSEPALQAHLRPPLTHPAGGRPRGSSAVLRAFRAPRGGREPFPGPSPRSQKPQLDKGPPTAFDGAYGHRQALLVGPGI